LFEIWSVDEEGPSLELDEMDGPKLIN